MSQDTPGSLAALGAIFTAVGGVLTVIVTKLLERRRDLDVKEVDRIDARDNRLWDRMEKRLLAQDEKITRLEAQVAQLLDENETLSRANLELTAQVARLQVENARMTTENVNMRERLVDLSKKIGGASK